MSLVLFDHQKRILELLTENDKFMLLAEVGVGKTLPVLVDLSNKVIAGEVEKALIVAPLSGLGAWERDIAKLPPDRQRLIRRHTKFVNYDKLSRKGKWQEKFWQSWDYIVLDEGHAIAKPTSNRTQYFVGKGKALGLASKAKYRRLLTGTLWANSRLEDLWAPLRFILDDEWMTWADFKRHFLVTVQIPGSYVEIVKGYRHRNELLSLVAQYSYRITKAECLDLPEQLPDEIVTVPWVEGKNASPFDAPTHALYEDALDSFVDALDMVMDNPLVRRTRLRQIATGHVRDEDSVYHLKSAKVKYLMELVQNNLPHKVVVFYQYDPSFEQIAAALKKAKIRFEHLNGHQKDKNVWRKFQSDDSIKVFVAQYQSGNSAIDLYSASYTIYFEPTDSSTILEQTRARTHRNGQHSPCNFTFLLQEGTIEVDMYERLKNHQDWDEDCWREIALRRLQGRGE